MSMAGPNEKEPLPMNQSHDSLPPLVFDPGEVTATYPVGALTKNVPDFKDGDHLTAEERGQETMTPPPNLRASLGKEIKHVRTGAKPQSGKKPKITQSRPRTKGKPALPMSPLALFALSLTLGGGLAVLIVIVTFLATQV